MAEGERPPEGIEPELTLQERTRQVIERNRQELARRIETGEIEESLFDLTYLIGLKNVGEPLTHRDVGNKAVVIPQKELETLGYLDMVLRSGERIMIDPDDTGYEPDDPFIIFPEELGDLAKEETSHIDK